jgi:hypothetical protein
VVSARSRRGPDPRSSFARDEHAGAGVPRLVTKQDAGIQPTFGGPGEVDRRHSEHPDPSGVVGEPFGEPQALAVLALRIVANCVLVDGDEGIGKRRGLADAEPRVISVGTLSQEGSVLAANERQVDHCGHDRGRVTEA